MQKTLIILRHGKAEPARGGQEDHERPLAERGIKEAMLMGGYMAEHGILPQRILCSTSMRTRQTYEGVQAAHGRLPPAEYEDAVYMASERQLLQALAKTPELVESVMLIGHNPGLHQLCIRLAAHGDAANLRKLAAAFPTCTLAVFEFPAGAWRDILTARGALRSLAIPAELNSKE